MDAEAERLRKNREYHAAYRAANRARVRAISAKWRDAHREEARARVAAWMAANPDKQRQSERAYRANNPDKRRAACADYRAKNVEKERSSRAKWAAANLDRLAAKAAARRATQMKATPIWADAEGMRALYTEAMRLTREMGAEYHVDHIVPLQSKIVCGLHCPANLRVILGRDNLSKSNRHWPDMP